MTHYEGKICRGGKNCLFFDAFLCKHSQQMGYIGAKFTAFSGCFAYLAKISAYFLYGMEGAINWTQVERRLKALPRHEAAELETFLFEATDVGHGAHDNRSLKQR